MVVDPYLISLCLPSSDMFPRITDLILDYYSKFRLRATTGLGTDWLEKGRLHHLSDSLRSRYEHDCEVRKVQRPFDEIWCVTDPNISLRG